MARGAEFGGGGAKIGPSIGARGGAGPRIGAGVEAGGARTGTVTGARAEIGPRTGSSIMTIARANSPVRSEVSRPNSFLGTGYRLGGENVPLSKVRDARVTYFTNKQITANETQKSTLGTYGESSLTQPKPENSSPGRGYRLGLKNIPLREVQDARVSYFKNNTTLRKSAWEIHSEFHRTQSEVSIITQPKPENSSPVWRSLRWRNIYSLQGELTPQTKNQEHNPHRMKTRQAFETKTPNFPENPKENDFKDRSSTIFTIDLEGAQSHKSPETETQQAYQEQDINKEEEKVEIYEYTKPNRMPDTIVSLTKPRRIF